MKASSKDSDDFTCAQKAPGSLPQTMFPGELRKCSSVCVVLSSFFDAHFPCSKIQNPFDYKGFVTLTCLMHSSCERPTPSVKGEVGTTIHQKLILPGSGGMPKVVTSFWRKEECFCIHISHSLY